MAHKKGASSSRNGRKAQEGTIASQVVESANGQTGYAVEQIGRASCRERVCLYV